MKLLLAFLLLFQEQFPMPEKAKGGQEEVTTSGEQRIPKSGHFTVPLLDMKHPSAYLYRPKCWAKERGDKQHLFRIENGEETLTVKGPPGALVYWECHGFMKIPPPANPTPKDCGGIPCGVATGSAERSGYPQ